MAYNNDKPFVAKSVDQIQKEYMESPFLLRNFYSGSSFTIVENHSTKSPLRFKTQTAQKTGRPYSVYLIKINDGYITKDLSLFGDEVVMLFRTMPKDITNLKDVHFANENGKWVFICQDDGSLPNTPKSNQIAASMEPAQQIQPAPTTIASMIMALHAAIETNINTGIKNTPEAVLKAAELIKPGDGAHLIQAAKDAGWIVEVGGVIRGT